MGQRHSKTKSVKFSTGVRHHSRKAVIKKDMDKQLKSSISLGTGGTSSSLGLECLMITDMDRDEDSLIAAHEMPGTTLVVPRRAHNICGVFLDVLIVTAPVDDPMERDLCIFELFNLDDPEAKFFALIANPEAHKHHARESFIAHLEVLKKCAGSPHVPTMIVNGPVKKLYFGIENFQQGEHDPEWKTRPALIVEMPKHCVFLASLRTLSPTGRVDTALALAAGLGLVQALNALHEKGLIHRYVTPWNFMVPVPFSLENLSQRMLNMDLSLATRLNQQQKNRLANSFIGTVKYSSIRTLHRHNVGPADDLISVIYIVAELISGKLPWRAIGDIEECADKKLNFNESAEYRRLPREIRQLYGILRKTYGMKSPDKQQVVDAFEQALQRRTGTPTWVMRDVPEWMEMAADY